MPRNRRVRSRWGIVEAEEETTTQRYSLGSRAGKWVADNIEILDGGYFQGRDSDRHIIYRFDIDGLSLRDLQQPNAIEWESQDATELRRQLWVNMPNYPLDTEIQAGDDAYAPAGGIVSHRIAAWAGADDALWGAGIYAYVEDGVTAELSLQTVTTATPAMSTYIKMSWDGATKKIGYWGSNGTGKPTITGAHGSNAALISLLTALANMGLLTDSTS